jgi:hypothetical protein
VESLRTQLVNKLRSLGVEEQRLPGRDDGFASLSYRGKAFAHFHSHSDHELDLRLTKSLIAREGLSHPKDSVSHPKRARSSPWIELRFHAPEDLDRVVRLVKLAIEAI